MRAPGARHNPVKVGRKMHTGYPVIVVAEIVVQATTEMVVTKRRDDITSLACMIVARNNEMIPLIAKYFSTILHELTVISSLQTNALMRYTYKTL